MEEIIQERVDRLKDSIEENQFDKPRWIDTSTMLCDPLTKYGNEAFPQRLVKTMETGILDLTPTVTSELKKMRQQKARLERAMSKA